MTSGIKTLVLNILSYVRLVTVEIAGLVHYASVLANTIFFVNILLERACEVELNYPKENCTEMVQMKDHEAAKNPLEAETQSVVASIMAIKPILDHLPMIFVVLYVGQWSDRNGRKLPLVISSIDGLLQSLVLIVCLSIPQINGYTIAVLYSLPRIFTGGDVIFGMAAFSYLTDTTKESSRTFRLGMLGVAMSLGVPIGQSLAGYLLEMNLSYTACLSVSSVLSLSSTLIVIFSVKNNAAELKSLCEPQKNYNSSCCSVIYQVLRKIMEVPFKRRDRNRRMKIILLLAAIMCALVPVYGEFNVMYLFVRNQLQWGPLEFGYFSTLRFVSHILGTTVMMGFLSYKLGISDPVLGFFAIFSQYGCSLLYIFAKTSWLFYLGPVVECFQSAMYSIAKAMLTKLIEPTEVGKLYSLISLMEVVNPLAMEPLYTLLYSATLMAFPTAIFVVSLLAVIPTQLIYLWFICTREKSPSSSSTPINERSLLIPSHINADSR